MGISFSLLDSVIQHLELTFIALLFSIVIGVLLGIILHEIKNSNKVISIISAIQTIPTLALLGFLVPILGIGKIPAIFVLIIYGCYPIIINTFSGLGQIDSEYIEISDALGMNEKQKLLKVKLPLSMAIIMAGIRTGLVQIIGLATLTSLIGSGGLGDYIYRGINTMNNDLIILGALPVTIIVLVLSYLLKQVEINWNFFYKHKIKSIFIIIVVSCFYLIFSILNIHPDKTIILGSKDFTESGLLTTIIAELIEEKTDIKVEKKLYMGTTDILHKALVKEEINGYVEYLGTSYLTVFNQTEKRDNMLDYVIKEYEKIGVSCIDPLGINNTFVVLQTKDTLEKYNIKTLSDLSKYANKFTLTAYAEFIEREDGLSSLINTYNLKFNDIKQLERSLGYTALAENKVDFMISFSTEPAIYKYNLQEIEDDKNLFLRYDAIPLINSSVLAKYPELEDILKTLYGKIDNETMSKLNNDVENNHRNEVDVAREWLISMNLI